MGVRIASLIPWLIGEAALVFLESRIWPGGGLWLLILWNPVLVLYRFVVGQLPRRGNRLTVDVVFAIFCFMAAFEGGWYLLPAVVAFVILDAAATPVVGRSLDQIPGEELAAMAAVGAGLFAVGAFVSGPIYASATTTVLSSGATITTESAPGLLVTGMSASTMLLLAAAAVLFPLTWLFATLDARRRSGFAYAGLAVATTALAALGVAGAFGVGLFILPGVAFAVVALWQARTSRLVSTAV